IVTTRPMCKEITSQVGETWSLWVQLESNGDAVRLTLAEGPLPPGPLDDAPAVFTGTRQENAIVAVRTGGFGGMACPGDAGITAQVGGDLTATISGDRIVGDYADIFGTGP